MESREGIYSRENVLTSGALSTYPVAPIIENSTEVEVVVPEIVSIPSSAATAGSAGTLEKRKRGRPRKTRADGTVPSSASAPTVPGNYLDDKSSGGLENASEKQPKIMTGNSGEILPYLTGRSFLPHVIFVNSGEDISMKIISFCQQGPQSVFVICCIGLVSNATLRRPNRSDVVTTYEGLFEIIKMSGSFTAKEHGGGEVSRAGGLTVKIASSDGSVIGGSLAGLLIAASPVQIILASFLSSDDDDSDPKPKKPKHEGQAHAAAPTTNHTCNVDNLNSNTPALNTSNFTNGTSVMEC